MAEDGSLPKVKTSSACLQNTCVRYLHLLFKVIIISLTINKCNLFLIISLPQCGVEMGGGGWGKDNNNNNNNNNNKLYLSILKKYIQWIYIIKVI